MGTAGGLTNDASSAAALSQSPSRHGGESTTNRIRAADQEIVNTDKAVSNLLREHTKLRRRLEEVRNPEFLIGLKRQLKETEDEIVQQQKLRKLLHNEQVKREHRLNHLAERND